MAVCQICHQEKFVGGAPAAAAGGPKLRVPDQADERLADRNADNSMDMAKICELPVGQREAMARI